MTSDFVPLYLESGQSFLLTDRPAAQESRLRHARVLSWMKSGQVPCLCKGRLCGTLHQCSAISFLPCCSSAALEKIPNLIHSLFPAICLQAPAPSQQCHHCCTHLVGCSSSPWQGPAQPLLLASCFLAAMQGLAANIAHHKCCKEFIKEPHSSAYN